MILTSKIFFRALPGHPNPEIQISGFKGPVFPDIQFQSIRRAPKNFLLAKTICGPHLLLLAHFDSTPPSWDSLYKWSAK